MGWGLGGGGAGRTDGVDFQETSLGECCGGRGLVSGESVLCLYLRVHSLSNPCMPSSLQCWRQGELLLLFVPVQQWLCSLGCVDAPLFADCTSSLEAGRAQEGRRVGAVS